MCLHLLFFLSDRRNLNIFVHVNCDGWISPMLCDNKKRPVVQNIAALVYLWWSRYFRKRYLNRFMLQWDSNLWLLWYSCSTLTNWAQKPQPLVIFKPCTTIIGNEFTLWLFVKTSKNVLLHWSIRVRWVKKFMLHSHRNF